MSWTDERVQLLEKLWKEGQTASEIAKQLGGVTRNAVIGKAHRMGLSGRPSPIKKADEEKKVKSPVVQKAAPSTDQPNIFSLKDKMCKWPIGDPRHTDFRFCGKKSMQGFPYCSEHTAAAYQSSSRRKALNIDDLAAEY